MGSAAQLARNFICLAHRAATFPAMGFARVRLPRSAADARTILRAYPRLYRRLADARFVVELLTARNSLDRGRVPMPAGGIDAESLAEAKAVEFHSQRA